MRCHDALTVEDVLDGVQSLTFLDDVCGRDALREGERGHDVGFDELIVRGAAGEDDDGSDAGFEFAYSFEGAFALLGRRGAVAVGRGTEHNDGVEVGEVCVVGGDGSVVDGSGDYGDCEGCEKDRQRFFQVVHAAPARRF